MSKDLARRSMDRRNFLKGTALVAGGAAVAGLAGCAPASQSAEGAGASAASSTGSDAAGVVIFKKLCIFYIDYFLYKLYN